MKNKSNSNLRNAGVVDTTPRRLPVSARPAFDDLCTDPVLTRREIRQRMISKGFRMNLAGIEKYASVLRRKRGIQRRPGRRATGTFAKIWQRPPSNDSGRIESIAQSQALALSVCLGPTIAREVVSRMATIVSGGAK